MKRPPAPLLLLLGLAPVVLHAAAPNAPSSLHVAPLGTSSHVLRWTDNSSDETGFIIERHDGGMTWTPVATVPANSTAYVHAGQVEGSLPTYRVKSSNGDGASSSPESTSVRMNVLFLLADDMGYKDIVSNRNPATDGPTIYETPALDVLKAESVNFDQAYASGPKCVVARRALQVGMHDFRSAAVATGGGIGPEMVTIGEAMQAGGYRTAFLGKWHLGGKLASHLEPHQPSVYDDSETPESQKVPSAQGYDVAIATGEYGAPPLTIGSGTNPQTGGYFPTLIAGSAPAEYWYGLPDLYTSSPTDYLTDRLTTETTNFIDDHLANHATAPFFITLAHYAVHTPLQADPSRVAYFEAKKAATNWAGTPPSALGEFSVDYTSHVRNYQSNTVYAAMMDGFDDSLAAIRSYLAATNDPRNPGKTLAETTIIIFSSDHGGKSTHALGDGDNSGIPTSNFPLRQGKTWVYEGGLKIPLIVHWPGIAAAGAETQALVNGADFYTTILDMTGTPRVPTQHLDSISFAEATVYPTVSPRTENFHWFTNADDGTGNPALGAYRKGGYKMVYHIIRRITELYDLEEDIAESNDIASIRPDLAEDMLRELIAKRDEVGETPTRPGSNSWDTELLVVAPVVDIPALPDGPPTALTGTAVGRTAVDLAWVDGSTNEERFVIQRKMSGGGAFNEIATVPMNTRKFRDTGLISGGTYQYRIQAETLAGWYLNIGGTNEPSNVVTVTTATTGTLPIIARGDVLSTLVDDTRSIFPLLNDQGEGLAIMALTQPGFGSATLLAGNAIQFTPPLGVGGETSMTYTATDSYGNSATGRVSISVLADHTVAEEPVFDETPDKTLVDAWEFNDANGTQIRNCVNSAPGTTLKFSAGTTPTTLDGALRFVQTSGAFRTTGTVSPGNRTLGAANAGIFDLSARFAAASFAGGSTSNAYAGVSMRDGALSTDLFAIRLQEVDGNIQLQLRNPGITVLQTITGTELTSPLEVRAEADLVARDVTVFVKVGAAEEVKKGTYPLDPATVTWSDYRISQLNNAGSDWGASAFIELDYLRIKSVVYPPIPSPAERYAAWWFGTSGTNAALRAPGADPDGDNVLNLLEFAIASSPGDRADRGSLFETLADTPADGDASAELFFTVPVREGAYFVSNLANAAEATVDGVQYIVEATTDFLTWAIPVEEVFPAMESGLPPVTEGWRYHTFRVPSTNGLSGKAFLRLRAAVVQ